MVHVNELKDLLLSNGANLVGFANLNGINQNIEMPYGVCVAVKLSPELIMSIHDGPNIFYCNEYNRINDLLDKIITTGTEYLIKKGFKALAQTRDTVKQNDNYETKLPHKTIGTRAGLGWIGKCGLLVTKEYGSGIRISSFLTNAELNCNEPINESLCDDCIECVKYCPGGAITGKSWKAKMERCELIDVKKCAKTAQALSMERIKKDMRLCGKCFEVCPYTIEYINRN